MVNLFFVGPRVRSLSLFYFTTNKAGETAKSPPRVSREGSLLSTIGDVKLSAGTNNYTYLAPLDGAAAVVTHPNADG